MADERKDEANVVELLRLARTLLAQVPASLASETGDLVRGLEHLAHSEVRAQVVAKLDSLQDDSMIVIPPESLGLVTDCVKLCKDPGRVAALLDRHDYWLHETRECPGLWLKLAKIGGPALNDPRFPKSAVVAGGSLHSVLNDAAAQASSDVDVFVSSEQEAEQVRELLRAWDYKLKPMGPNLTRAKYFCGQVQVPAQQDSSDRPAKRRAVSVVQQLDLVVHPLAARPERLVRTFDAACCEAWAVAGATSVTLTASAAESWKTMTLPLGRAGPLSWVRRVKLERKGFKIAEGQSASMGSCSVVTTAAVALHMDQFFARGEVPEKAEQPVYGNFLRRNLVFPWSDPVPPDTKQWALLTDWMDSSPRPEQLAALAKHGVGLNRVRDRRHGGLFLFGAQMRLLLAPNGEAEWPWTAIYQLERAPGPVVEF